ncbi:MAG: hypothetical protein Q4G68_08700 [Planctomycetia bacterium]|nr:hypothetical protein [Planctomycetia bacterium]
MQTLTLASKSNWRRVLPATTLTTQQPSQAEDFSRLPLDMIPAEVVMSQLV